MQQYVADQEDPNFTRAVLAALHVNIQDARAAQEAALCEAHQSSLDCNAAQEASKHSTCFCTHDLAHLCMWFSQKACLAPASDCWQSPFGMLCYSMASICCTLFSFSCPVLMSFQMLRDRVSTGYAPTPEFPRVAGASAEQRATELQKQLDSQTARILSMEEQQQAAAVAAAHGKQQPFVCCSTSCIAFASHICLFCVWSKSVCLWIVFQCHFGVVSLLSLMVCGGPVAKALLLQSYPCVATDIVMKFAEVTCLSVLTPTT